MFRRLRDSEFADRTEDLRGATLYGADDDKIGKIDDVLFDPETYQAKYAIIDAGGWLTSRKFLIPSDHILTSKTDPDAFTTRVTRKQIEDLPAFDDKIVESDERFVEYENRYRTKWNTYGLTMPTSRHPRIERFENRLRTTPVTAMPASTTTRTATSSNVIGTPVSVYGVYRDRDKLERAVERLKADGFASNDISVIFPDKARTETFAHEHNTKAPEGAAAGGGTGIVVGGVLGWLAGIGTLAIPGIGPLLAAGPIVAALAGAGAGGAIGGLAGALIGMGVPEIEAKRFEKEIKEGRMLVAVRCNDARLAGSARAALVQTEANDVFETGERRAA